MENDGLMDAAGDDEMANKKKKKVKPGSFQGMGLSQGTFKAIMKMGYNMPTPIQRKTIPVILEGQDVVAMARTGSGKTAAFLIPIVERLGMHNVAVGVRAVVLSPTRELAMQTAKFTRQLSKFGGLRCCLLVGGQAMETQFEHLAANPDIIIASPGRLGHHMVEAELSLSRVEMLVFDEADRLFELGFAEQLAKILAACPVTRQALLFSATLPSQLVAFSRAGVKNPVFVRLDVETTLSENLELQFLHVRKDEKLAAAISVLRRLHKDNKSTIVFVATRHHVEFFGELLKAIDLTVSIVYGTMDQDARELQISNFRRGFTSILVTTDVAARGVDIPLLDHVLNFDFPPSAKLFVHRSGRTARAGRSGLSISLVTLEDLPYAVELMLFLGQKMGVVGGTSEQDDETGKKRPLLGSVPALEHEVETLEQLLEDGTHMQSLYKSMKASYHLYHKSRPSASKQSVKRSKELLVECGGPTRLQGCIHPAFRNADDPSKGRAIGSACTDNAGMKFIQELRQYRPKVEKIGNVISTGATRTMDLAKKDNKVAAAAKRDIAEAEEEEFDGDSDDNEDKPGRQARRGTKRKREKEPPKPEFKEKGPRTSKRGSKQQSKGSDSTGIALGAEDLDDFEVEVDGAAIGKGAAAKGAIPKPTIIEQPGKSAAKRRKGENVGENFYLSVERDMTQEAKERGLDMEEYQLDLMPDDSGQIKSAKSVVRWDAKKKKYLPIMVAADGKVIKSTRQTNESGQKVKGDFEKADIYTKWAKSSKNRVQKPGEHETGKLPLGKLKQSQQQGRSITFDGEGNYRVEGQKPEKAVGADGNAAAAGRKPVVPFHGEVEEKYLTNKQKRVLKRRDSADRVGSDGKAGKSELRTPAQIQKEKKDRQNAKLKQNPGMRKAKSKNEKEKRMKLHEDRQMKFGAKTRSKMLVFDGPRTWNKGKARPKNGHGKSGLF